MSDNALAEDPQHTEQRPPPPLDLPRGPTKTPDSRGATTLGDHTLHNGAYRDGNTEDVRGQAKTWHLTTSTNHVVEY
ncbi:hypothetical protein Taro_013866 [Colocasia esculenta]|uniref:Uncharacterized protein n=1 Tax=Colocasia esculenta TaxID=4460 RepID=A0A843UHC3_COLES|nr:hypothetical protein [Colocasia esculenta]